MNTLEAPVTLYTPSQVSQVLGVGQGMVRRYQLAYEKITRDALPRDQKTSARLVTEDVLKVLEQSRAIIKENTGVSVEEAISAALGVLPLQTNTKPLPDLLPADIVMAVQHVIEEKQTEQNQRLERLENHLINIKEEIKKYDELKDLKQRNRYLLEEIQRRESQVISNKKKWWRFW